MVKSFHRRQWSALLPLIICSHGAHADAPINIVLPEITITADRIEEPVGQTGSSVTIVPSSEIEKLGPKGMSDVLRSVVGVDVVQVGGIGSVTSVRLRGASAGQTLVLIDGVRIGDAASTDGSLDFGNLSAVDVERIEVLRGPQSALYGSDAMGGVINIITRKGTKKPRRSVTVEAGSYGTLSTRATMSGGDDKWTYSLGLNLLHSDGFPQYGYRINRPLTLADGITPLPPLPSSDPVNKGGASARFSYKVNENVTLDFGFTGFGNRLSFDNSFAAIPSDVFSRYNSSLAWIGDGFVRATVETGALSSKITAFGNVTTRSIWEAEGCFDAAFSAFNCKSNYRGTRAGGEYQGDLNLGPYGGLVFGLRSEHETAATSQAPNPNDGSFNPISAQQTTNSGFAEYRLKLLSRLDLTVGGRIDAIEGGATFETWRTTAAYHIDETGTKLRATVGTGDKAPTLYQRFSQFGATNLNPESSLGWDVGFDQKLFSDRITASATYFDTRYQNLIDFAATPSCTAAQIVAGGGCYYNVGRARNRGVETSLDAWLLPNDLRLKASYTYLDARNVATNVMLLRAPLNKASLSLIYSGIPNLEIEPRVTLVSARLDGDFITGSSVVLAPYAKFDVLANYKVNDNLTVFARVENLTDARYEEAYNFGTAGRSYYGGVNYAW